MSGYYNRSYKLSFVCLWFCLFLVALFIWFRSGIALTDVPSLLDKWLQSIGLLNAALVYIFLYAIRPLILFPATLLTIASGLIFGPWLGTLFTIIGENASANFGFILSRWLARSSIEQSLSGILIKWDRRIRDNGLVTVMTMRLIMLPFDLVNFGCGLTAVRHRDYAIGTFIGILPSLIGFVLLGGVAAHGVNNRMIVLVISAIFMLTGFGIAHYLKHREQQQTIPDNASEHLKE